MKVAAWQYPIERVASWQQWRAKLAAGIGEAAGNGAALCVVPEYAAMELTSLLAPELDLGGQLVALQPLLADYVGAYRELAQRHRVAIVAGSFPEAVAGGEYRNRLRVHGPAGDTVEIEKLLMTRFEREHWGIAAGAGQTVVDLGGARLGVAICYDSEFPLLVRRLAAAGAQVIAVPSCTDALSGYHRVRIACQARALENQCYVIQAPTVGAAPWSLTVDTNTGAAGVFGPVDRGIAADGVLALGTLDAPAWVYADLDLAALERARRDGEVLGHRDWDRPAHLGGDVTTATLAPVMTT